MHGRWALRSGATELTLVARGVVSVDESLASRSIEQLRRGELNLCRGARRLGLFQCSPQGGTLRTVAHGRRARLTHVLLGGCDIRHEFDLNNREKLRVARREFASAGS